MTDVKNTKRPYLSSFSTTFAVISLPIANYLGDSFGPKDDLLGYSSSGIVLIVLLLFLSLGLILGLASIYRNEQPKILSFLALFLNGAFLFWILWILMNMPS